MTRHLIRPVALILAAVLAWGLLSPTVLAGAKPATGIVQTVKIKTAELKRALDKRHALGLEYGWDNKEFQSLLETFVADMILSAGVGATAPTSIVDDVQAAKTVALAIRKELQRIEYAGKNGIDFTFVHKAFRTGFELGIKWAENAKLVPPGTSASIKVGKLATAYVTGYVYGFTVGI